MPQPSAKQFSGIFVSYRRDDSPGHAGRLYDKLVSHFGKNRIFMDIDTIEPGEDFVTVIENAVDSCDILIAVIGRHWLSSADPNTSRLDNPNDFVRLEIATALNRAIKVIPVLVQRASMPKQEDLPEDLVKLSRRNFVQLSDHRWHDEVDELITFLKKILDDLEEKRRGLAREEEELQRRDAQLKIEESLRLAEAEREAEAQRQQRETDEKEVQRLSEEALPAIRPVEVGSGRAGLVGSKRALIIGTAISLLIVVAVAGIWLRRAGESTGQDSTGRAILTPSPQASATPAPTATPPTKTENPAASPLNTPATNVRNANKSVTTQSSKGFVDNTKRKQDSGAAARQKCALAALENRPCTP